MSVKSKKYFLSIVIPCFNESKGLKKLFLKIKKSAENYQNIEFIIVENGSSDNSRSTLINYEKKFNIDNIKFVYIDKNIGYGNGIKKGLYYASPNSEYIGWTHGDSQTDILDVEKAYKILKKNKSSGNLCIKGKRIKRPYIDSFISKAMSILSSLIFFPILLDEINAQPSIFYKDLKLFILNGPNDFNLDLFAFVGAKIKGFKFKRFNVFFPKRNQGKSSWNNGLLSKIRFSTNSIKYIINFRKNLIKLSNL
ncbi:MAG: glycosyl transferase family 2 [Rickettsiales bacterium]|nr:glycosyl transferase family 2 [Rickettsiales bacterium]|tara:strand:- start:23088 stop:23843 length:756 start_codon:yes stop_codon:yes gene_type:complete